MTMLEKAARALWSWRESGFPRFTAMTWESGTPEAKAATVELVRAVLMAVREPDEAVSEAGWQGMAGDASSWSWHHMERPQDEAFTAMIDAILTEPDNPA